MDTIDTIRQMTVWKVVTKALHIPRMDGRRWILQLLDHFSLLEGHILPFARTNKYLQGEICAG